MVTQPDPQSVALKELLYGMTKEGELYDKLDDDRLLCYACGHECRIPEGRPGVCRIRFNEGGVLKVPTGYVGGLAVDPIEKKPFFHAFPGRNALSIGMLGCDLHCSYCQNWVTSQALRDPEAVSSVRQVSADQVADLAVQHNAPVVASTYNEPLITSEWAVDILKHASPKGLVGAYISNGNATERVLDYIRPYVQLYKVDLKTFDDRHYRDLGGQLPHVKRTIRQLHEKGFWLEVVTLIVPEFNDSEEELKQMAGFLADISPDIPWHVTAFHSDYKMNGTASTTPEQLMTAAEIGKDAGLRFVYAGNRPGMTADWESTYCPDCGKLLIRRQGFMAQEHHLSGGCCPDCGRSIPGFWDRDTVIAQENMGEPMWLAEKR